MLKTLISAASGLFISGLFMLATATAALAGSDEVSPGDVADFTVLPGWRTDSGTYMTALRITLAPGWKTYWRAPGEAGIPPQFDWAGSKNLAAVSFHWPTPDVFYQNGMRTVGYKRELILPIELSPKQPGQDIALRARIALGVCRDICMPVSVRVSADLTGSGAVDGRIRGALNDRPDTMREAGLRDIDCTIEPIADGLRLTANIDMPRLGPDEVAVFELPDQSIWVSEAEANRRGRILTAVTEMVPPGNAPFMLDRSKLRITVLGAGRAVDIMGCTG